MLTNHAEILKNALMLPEQDRIQLASELIESVAGPPPGLAVDDPGFVAELERRMADGSQPIAWEEVRRQLDGELIR